MMKVAFVGQHILQPSERLRENLAAVVRKLVEKENADEFLFVGRGDFDALCFSVVSELKTEYPYLRSVLVRGEGEYITQARADRLLARYDVIYPDAHCGTRTVSFIKRYREMIDKSDAVVAYVDEANGVRLGKSMPALILTEARESKKRVLELAQTP